MPIETTTNSVTPATLCHYTRGTLVVPQLKLRDTAGVISELSHALQRDGCVPDVLPFYHTALNRELMANSAVECGIAFPHARAHRADHRDHAWRGHSVVRDLWSLPLRAAGSGSCRAY